jgi:aspartate aminotransferase
MRETFRSRRAVAMKSLSQIPSLSTAPVSGAFYLFPRYSQDHRSEDLALKILKEGVICAPGSAFGSRGEGHLRFSYANSEENIAKGLGIVGEVLARL